MLIPLRLRRSLRYRADAAGLGLGDQHPQPGKDPAYSRKYRTRIYRIPADVVTTNNGYTHVLDSCVLSAFWGKLRDCQHYEGILMTPGVVS